MRRLALSISVLAIACGATHEPPKPVPAASASAAAVAPSALDELRLTAPRVAATVKTDLARRFLERVSILPHQAPRTLFRDAKKTRYLTEAEAAALPDAERATLVKQVADEELYYTTKYGSPLSYARPLDLLFETGVRVGPGTRVLDFGYGYAGHLRLLASLGADATGVDVDPMLRALYSQPGDQGAITGPGGETGHLRLLDGRFPADPAIVRAVGAGYDLVISKNVLKRGYIHPDRPAKKEQLIDLGAPDDVVLKGFFDALKPGGSLLIYNICPALTPPDKPFVPWSDGRSPFSKKQFEDAGFTVVAMDQDDTDSVRKMGKALGWDADPDDKWDLDHDLSVLWTLVKR
jgi:SAM-dependent methyltransferase